MAAKNNHIANSSWGIRNVKERSSDFIDQIPGKSKIENRSSKNCTNIDSPSLEKIPFNVVIDLRNHQKIMTLDQLSRRTVMT